MQEIFDKLGVQLTGARKAFRGQPKELLHLIRIRRLQADLYQHGQWQRVIGTEAIGLFQGIDGAAEIPCRQGANGGTVQRVIAAQVVGGQAGRLTKVFGGLSVLAVTELHLSLLVQFVEPVEIHLLTVSGKGIRHGRECQASQLHWSVSWPS